MPRPAPLWAHPCPFLYKHCQKTGRTIFPVRGGVRPKNFSDTERETEGATDGGTERGRQREGGRDRDRETDTVGERKRARETEKMQRQRQTSTERERETETGCPLGAAFCQCTNEIKMLVINFTGRRQFQRCAYILIMMQPMSV